MLGHFRFVIVDPPNIIQQFLKGVLIFIDVLVGYTNAIEDIMI